ncbi:MAG: hypothetical protein ABR981_01875 [Candidatus Micrarchaeaceae archaeon]|jgi:hypothetical protein
MPKSKNSNKKILILVVSILIIIAIISLLIHFSNKPIRYNTSYFYQCTKIYIPFSCQDASLNSTTNIVTVRLGQNSGTTWTSANFAFTPNNLTSVTSSFSSYPINTLYSTSGLLSAQTVPVSFISNGNVNNTIWAQYTTSNNSTFQYAEIATINIRAS